MLTIPLREGKIAANAWVEIHAIFMHGLLILSDYIVIVFIVLSVYCSTD